MARWEDTCKHGCDGICMLCIREGENKPPADEKPDPNAPRYPGDYEKQWWEED